MLLDVTLSNEAVSALARMVCCALTLNLVRGELGLCLSLTQRTRGVRGEEKKVRMRMSIREHTQQSAATHDR